MTMLKDTVLKSRSFRSFSPEREITQEEMLFLLDTARRVPSARNLQPLKYRYCITKEENAKLFSLTSWAGALRPLKLPPEGHEPTGYIVICTDNDISPKDSNRFLGVDIGIAAQTIMLASCEIGLGGCMLGAFDPQKVSEDLNISE